MESLRKQDDEEVIVDKGGAGPDLQPRSSQAAFEVSENLSFTPTEQAIFSTLRSVVEHFGLSTQLRVAGGWVRDKLIGRESHDIDIALDNMLGREFAEKVNEYLTAKGEQVRGVGVIQSNPDQSKHLETATMMIHGLWIDLVNLRAETYADTSRIPEMKFGTAEEDALRRDLTINSLFYNISTEKVEDWTTRGIADLKSGIVRTPLPALQTFLDDPLRVLRAVRFAARFGFHVDSEIRSAARDGKVKAALASKISRERIGKEVDLIMRGPSAAAAVGLLVDFELFDAVFTLPAAISTEAPQDLPRSCLEDLNQVSYRLHEWSSKLPPSMAIGTESRALCELAALLLPLRKTTFLDKKKSVPVVQFIIRESLKLKSATAESVVSLHCYAQEFQNLVQDIGSMQEASGSPQDDVAHEMFNQQQQLRISAGKLLRKSKDLWIPAIVLCTILNPMKPGEMMDGTETPESALMTGKRKRSLDDWAEKCLATWHTIISLGLSSVWQEKPMVDGRKLKAILGAEVKGPEIGIWLEKAMDWQLANREGSVDECVSWLKKQYSAKA